MAESDNGAVKSSGGMYNWQCGAMGEGDGVLYLEEKLVEEREA
jgi:hypothetical protein